jgi:hypothetical protein
VYWWFQVENMHGKAHLAMDVATESEVADTKGSTATLAVSTMASETRPPSSSSKLYN